MLAVSTLQNLFIKTTPLKSQENAFCQILYALGFSVFFLSDCFLQRDVANAGVALNKPWPRFRLSPRMAVMLWSGSGRTGLTGMFLLGYFVGVHLFHGQSCMATDPKPDPYTWNNLTFKPSREALVPVYSIL